VLQPHRRQLERNLEEAWVCWLEFVGERKKGKQKAAKALLAWSGALLASAFRTWLGVVADAKYQRAAAQLLLGQAVQTTLVRSLDALS
jgi:hypothetical protein